MDILSIFTDEVNGVIEVDNFRMGIYFDMQMLKEHTNLDISVGFNEMIEQYDALCKSGAMTKVLALFSDDYYFMNDMLKQELENLKIENSLERHLVKMIYKINNMLDEFGDKFGNVDFGKLLPKGLDVSTFLDMIGNLK